MVLEKPIGHDLASAQAINDAVGAVFDERQIFRIDHYLGKESVQNLLVTRFANTLLEPLWNSSWIDHVQITAAESLGVGAARRLLRQIRRTARHAAEPSACRCCAWSRWNRRLTSTAKPSATRSSRFCRRSNRCRSTTSSADT